MFTILCAVKWVSELYLTKWLQLKLIRPKTDPKAQAVKAAKAVKSDQPSRRSKDKTKVTFHRPRTLKKDRNPKPDGTKKAYVRLTPDYDALDVANKIGII
ncbi:60S ribosomal protein L23A [Datura stramonium]|uniref:60S ribosomal protein L23A n=1 Tax=Datura stramonium TaxID=4076 RepID=A0ABS8T560_DATST|nr:60S ribosomal protein L23A [Datura stramonium]